MSQQLGDQNRMAESAGLMAGKKGLVMGVANDRSLAWGITKAVTDQGADVAITYQNETMEKRVRPLADSLGAKLLLECDVSDKKSMAAVFHTLEEHWGTLDFLIHAIAFSDKNELTGRYVDTSAENFALTMSISCFSFTALCRAAAPLMKNGGSIVTLTYAGSERVVPHYNVMGVAKAALESSVRYLASDLGPQGIRVNAISAGPVRTLAGSAIAGAREILKWNQQHSPLRRNVALDDLGGAALFLLSDLSASVTGEVVHVDGGYHAIGIPAPVQPPPSA